jgi:hypothetical protein
MLGLIGHYKTHTHTHTHTHNSMVMFEVFYFFDDDSLELVYKLSNVSN